VLRLKIARPAIPLLEQGLTSLLLLVVSATGVLQHSRLDASTAIKIAVVLGLCSLWHFHLSHIGSPWYLNLVVVLVTAWELSTRIDPARGVLLLTGCVFAYLTIWMFAAYQRQPGLQPVATIALVICAAILLNPTVAFSCAVLALGFFVLNPHKAVGGRFGYAFLLFTPASLCISAIVVLAFLGSGNLMAYASSAPAPSQPDTPFMLHVFVLSSEFLIPITILVARVIARRASGVDLVVVLLVFVAIMSTKWLPAYCDRSGVWLMGLGGSAFLLTNAFERSNSLTRLGVSGC